METWLKKVIILYTIIVALKIGLSYFISAPSTFSDYYGYAKIARSIFYHNSFMVHDHIASIPPLYPILLSLSYLFKDMVTTYFFMKVINAFISSLIIFPAWLLGKEFLTSKKAMILTAMVAVLPPHFAFSFEIMSENLFYPLFLFSIYFIYKSFTEESYKWDIWAGIFSGLTYLTKINALILPFAVIFVFLFKMFKKDYIEIKKKIVLAVFFLITLSPWLIRNGLIFGFDKKLFIGEYESALTIVTDSLSNSFGSFLLILSTLFVLYLCYLALASGLIFFLANFFIFSKFNDKKIVIFSLLTFSSIILSICLAARHFNLGEIKYQTIFPWLAGRVIGRYVEVVLPLILITGLLGLECFNKKTLRVYITSTIIILFSSQLVFFQLFPINNMSLTWLGVIKFILDFFIYQKITFETIFSYWYLIIFLVIFTFAILLIIYLYEHISIRKLLSAFVILFFLISLLNFAIICWNSYVYWYRGEQMQLGLWFNKYDPGISTVLFDERDGCKIVKTNQTCIYNPFTGGGFATVMGFWMNDEIKVGAVDNLKDADYVVSRHKLDLPLLKETENGIFLYKAKQGSGL